MENGGFWFGGKFKIGKNFELWFVILPDLVNSLICIRFGLSDEANVLFFNSDYRGKQTIVVLSSDGSFSLKYLVDNVIAAFQFPDKRYTLGHFPIEIILKAMTCVVDNLYMILLFNHLYNIPIPCHSGSDQKKNSNFILSQNFGLKWVGIATTHFFKVSNNKWRTKIFFNFC